MQNEQECGSTEAEYFYASKNGPLARSKLLLWISLLVFAVPVAFVVLQRGPFLWATLGFFLVIGGVAEWGIRKQLRPGKPLVTLSDDALASTNLSGREKRLSWSAIEKVSVESLQGTRVLAFVLRGVKCRRGFWDWNSSGRPLLTLTPFSPDDQERLLDAINKRHVKFADCPAGEQFNGGNEIREEREFQEKLKELQPITWVTYALIVVNLAIWGAMLANGASFINTPADRLFDWGGNAASAVQQGEWWRMISAIFLHSGFLHVAMNMLGLYSAGVTVERIYGSGFFLLLYIGAGLLGSALSLHFSAQDAVSVGASGAVFGVTGALLVAVFQHRRTLPKTFSRQTISGVGFFVVYALLQGLGKQGIDNAAHVGGLLGGCLAAFILPERFDMAVFQKLVARRALAVLLVLGAAIACLAAMAPPAKLDLGRVFASADIVDRALKRFDAAVKNLQLEMASLKDGKMSEREADARSRAVHAPEFRAVVDGLDPVVLRPGDPRESFVKDIKRLSELLAEALAMESVFNEETGKYEPTNPARAAEIDAEIGKVNERVTKFINATRKKP